MLCYETAVQVDSLARLLDGHRIAVLTGAGCSTESGIPDYRGPETARRARNPIRYNAFTGSPQTRKRYWARSMLGYGRVAGAEPNAAHRALAELERRGHVLGVITQNVDGLHRRAGSRALVELHGNLATASCLDCGARHQRAWLQQELLRRNPGWQRREVELAPDGDAEASAPDDFEAVGCSACGGALKPDVVFFGESVPRERVERAYEMVASASALLVAGTSLVVFSGFRFVRAASKQGKTIAIVNLSPTRGDELAKLCVREQVGTALPELAARLSPSVDAKLGAIN